MLTLGRLSNSSNQYFHHRIQRHSAYCMAPTDLLLRSRTRKSYVNRRRTRRMYSYYFFLLSVLSSLYPVSWYVPSVICLLPPLLTSSRLVLHTCWEHVSISRSLSLRKETSGPHSHLELTLPRQLSRNMIFTRSCDCITVLFLPNT
jgi:hypothetical protein